MPTPTESNACRPCARSKRKCGRQLPSCARCKDKGTSCVYPLSRGRAASLSRPLWSGGPRGSVPPVAIEDELLAAVGGNASPRTANASLFPPVDDLMWDLTFPSTDTSFAAPMPLIQAPARRADWFLAPETWKIQVMNIVDTSAAMTVGRASIWKYVADLQSWSERWVAAGSNPFIHARLYCVSFPACVQVAYATLAAYIHRNPANKDALLQIVGDRSNDLLQDNGAFLDSDGTEGWIDGGGRDVDLFAQLARVHALIVYQIIGLFDGDIRSRYIAEGHMAVLQSWANKLLRSAAKALSNTHSVPAHLVGCMPRPSTYPQQQWYLWILSESIRRTWLVAASIGCVYSALQKHWAPCAGGVMYTNRKGLWNAASAPQWESQCLENDAAFMQRFECGKLIANADPADIDEFGMAMMDLTFNADLLENWRDGSGYL